MSVANIKRRRGKIQENKYASLIASPFDMGSVLATNPSLNTLILPYAGKLGISFSVAINTGQMTISRLPTRTFGIPNLLADEIHRLGFFEQGQQLDITSSVIGIATIYFFDEWFKSYPIATATFT